MSVDCAPTLAVNFGRCPISHTLLKTIMEWRSLEIIYQITTVIFISLGIRSLYPQYWINFFHQVFRNMRNFKSLLTHGGLWPCQSAKWAQLNSLVLVKSLEMWSAHLQIKGSRFWFCQLTNQITFWWAIFIEIISSVF